jgi:hypothetical protein
LIIFGTLFILVVLFLPGGFVEAWERIKQVLTRQSRRRGFRLSPQEES